jgi:ABC-type amino acid transport system permease subunit
MIPGIGTGYFPSAFASSGAAESIVASDEDESVMRAVDLALSQPIGFALAQCGLQGELDVRAVVIEFILSTPFVTQLFFAFFVVPELCEPVVVPPLMIEVGYNCFGVGEASRAEWALYIGGVAALIVAGVKAVTQKST